MREASSRSTCTAAAASAYHEFVPGTREIAGSSPKEVLTLSMAEQDIKDSVWLPGATTQDFRVATNLALKKVCA